MSSRKRRVKKKPTPKELPEPVKAALEKNRPEQFAEDRRPGAAGGSRKGNASFRRAGQRRHQAK
jgi:hypothetical protein